MSHQHEKDMRLTVEFLPQRLYYVALSTAPVAHSSKHFFCIDQDMVYWNFYLDFGPLNLGHLYRYCVMLNNKLNDPKLKEKIIYFYSSTHAHKRANAVYLICSWALLFLNKTPEEAFRPFKGYPLPFPSWHDATPTVCPFQLTILDTLRGLYRARDYGFFDFSNFNVEEYEHFEQVENGDLNWVMDGKFIAFAGPHGETPARQVAAQGYRNLRPDDYVPYFKKRNVTLVVRLNKAYYEAKRFTMHGIDHNDMYFLDGSNPPDPLLAKFIHNAEQTPGVVAVHCKAGLGRTGCCIGCYMMKHFRLTGEELIGWLRIVRPGSIIGPQQQYMREMQPRMWREGDVMRQRIQQYLQQGGHPNGGGADCPFPASTLRHYHTYMSVQAKAAGAAAAAQSERPSSGGGRGPGGGSSSIISSPASSRDSLARKVQGMNISDNSSASISSRSAASSISRPVSRGSSSSQLAPAFGLASSVDAEGTQGDLLQQRRHQQSTARASNLSAAGAAAVSSASLSPRTTTGTTLVRTANTSSSSSSSTSSSPVQQSRGGRSPTGGSIGSFLSSFSGK